MNGRCSNCRFWGDRLDAYGRAPCRRILSEVFERAIPTGALAVVRPVDGEVAALHTTPDFGCVQFQPAERAVD